MLICVSGGHNSTALLKMTGEALFNYKTRKMFFKAKALHIEEGPVLGWSAEESQAVRKGVETLCSSSQVDLDVIGLEQVYEVDWTRMLGQRLGNAWVEKVQAERKKMGREEKIAKF